MRGLFYPSLAWMGIVKNRRFYLPYLFACVGMIMMFYIVAFLCCSPVIGAMNGGMQLQGMLGFGRWVIAIFSVIFLFYCHSFLMRRRKQEFGLYNILGMGKPNIGRILFWESLYVGGISLFAGLGLGIVFSKLAELCVIRLLDGAVTFAMHLEWQAVEITAGVYGALFVLLLLHSMRQVHTANPLALLHSDKPGEKPPRANWLLAVLGVLVLGVAYGIAVGIEDPLTAMLMFFVAVVLVIIATYMLLIAGSVALCRLLQKNRRYYYKTNHFISVSSMSYRMKRNGAGLASICILCTMVLVMLSSTICLYVGIEDSMRNRYPRNVEITLQVESTVPADGEKRQEIRELTERLLEKHGLEKKGLREYTVGQFAGTVREDGYVDTDPEKLNSFSVNSYSNVLQIFVFSLDDYNRLMGTNLSAAEGEAYAFATKKAFTSSVIRFGDGEPIKIKGFVKKFLSMGADVMVAIPSVYLFVPDWEQTLKAMENIVYGDGEAAVSTVWYYGFDLDCDEEKQIAFGDELQEELKQADVRWSSEREPKEPYVNPDRELAAKEKRSFYDIYGSLLFLGILLGIIFSVATVMIMYYKQLSEGYEDQQRFDILQKVGMTRREIRKSINSQMLTVFFLPVLLAGLHLAFAFPLIRKMLLLFGLTDMRLLVLTTLGCCAIFLLIYIIAYRVTSRAYYQIVAK